MIVREKRQVKKNVKQHTASSPYVFNNDLQTPAKSQMKVVHVAPPWE